MSACFTMFIKFLHTMRNIYFNVFSVNLSINNELKTPKAT